MSTTPRPTPPTRGQVTAAMVAGARAGRERAGVRACPWSLRAEHPAHRLLARAWVGAYAAEAPEPQPDPPEDDPPGEDGD